jgi:hypothetical protein
MDTAAQRSTKGDAPTRERIEEAIREEIERRSQGPKEINNGGCEGFARAVQNRLFDPDEVEVTGAEIDGAWTMGRWGGHDWICAHHLNGGEGLHFDAECPEGTADWKDLHFYKRKREDPSSPIGPIGEEILRGSPTRVRDEETVRWIEYFSDWCVVYSYRTNGTKRNSRNPDATYTPTIWIKGDLPTKGLKDCLHRRCPEREDWREWLDAENECRTRRDGFKTYDALFEEGIREPIIIDGQGPLIWDGWHRTAWAISEGKETIPAFLGVAPGQKPALDRLQEESR